MKVKNITTNILKYITFFLISITTAFANYPLGSQIVDQKSSGDYLDATEIHPLILESFNSEQGRNCIAKMKDGELHIDDVLNTSILLEDRSTRYSQLEQLYHDISDGIKKYTREKKYKHSLKWESYKIKRGTLITGPPVGLVTINNEKKNVISGSIKLKTLIVGSFYGLKFYILREGPSKGKIYSLKTWNLTNSDQPGTYFLECK